MDSEKTHDFTLKSLKWIEQSFFRFLLIEKRVEDPIEVFGIQFPNKIGLAAGLDKNGACIDAFAALGFGHIEIGTVTPRPQPGNPKPRLFRLVKHNALINRFGFNNLGVDNLIENVKRAKFDGILGINIGKNFDTPVEKAVDDYITCMQKVYLYASYITVNISSPNTANLRKLQFGQALEGLLIAIKNTQKELTEKHQKRVPILIKIAPDLSDEEIDELATAFVQYKIDGVIATNTTFSREGVESSVYAKEQGGLSGAPVLKASNQVIKKLSDKTNGVFPIIGVGGILNGQDAKQKIQAGASLVQVYSGFIYQGSKLISQVAKALKG